MIIDGKKIAEEIKISLKKELEASGKKLKLAIVAVNHNEASKKFIEKKVKFAEEISAPDGPALGWGVKTKIYDLPAEISTSQLRKKMAEVCHIKENDGVILQLPLPAYVNTQYVLNGITASKDVDVLSSRSFGDFATSRSKILPPVVGAIKEIFDRNNIEAKGKNVTVIGAGILVGKPAANWLMNQGATVSVINEFTPDISKFTREADIIVSGTGKQGLIKSEMVKNGVIIIDVAGDVDQVMAQKASIFTPTPGGVGPITVATIFKNLLMLSGK